MAHSGAEFDASAWADFAEAAGLLVASPTTSTSPATTAPGLVGEVAAQPAPGLSAGEAAAPPTSGEPALVELTPGDDDIAPPVLGVPSSSEDEEELIADPVGAPMVGAPPAAGETADVGVQTSPNVIIPAFDLVDTASQTDGQVVFSSFVGDTPQAALATAIRALSPGSLLRLDGALRQAQAQPLVDVAPSLQGGGETSPAPPDIDLLGVAPGDQQFSSGGIVDPGPGPASARIFWEEQNATAVAEQAAIRPLPDDDFDPPATALEAYLRDQDVAAGKTTSPSPSGPTSSSSKSPGAKTPFRKAPPPALVVEEPEAKVGKAPPVPYPDRKIAFLEPPKRPPVKRAPVQPEQAPPPAAAPAPPSSSAASSSEPVLASASAEPSPTPAPEDTAPEPKANADDAMADHLRRQARSRWPAASRGCGSCTMGPLTPRPSRAALSGRSMSSARRRKRQPWPRPSPKARPFHHGDRSPGTSQNTARTRWWCLAVGPWGGGRPVPWAAGSGERPLPRRTGAKCPCQPRSPPPGVRLPRTAT